MGKNAQVPSDQPHEGTPGWVWRCDAAISRYSQKTCLFGRFFKRFFHVQPQYQNDAIFVHIEGLRPWFEQAELRGTQMGPTGPPNAEIAILENRAFW